MADAHVDSRLGSQAAAHLAALVLALGLESFLRVQHRRQQQAGYLAFYWRTRGLLSIPTRAAALAQARAVSNIAVESRQICWGL